MQYYSYTYVADAVAGLLFILLSVECGEAYNISDQSSDIRLKDLAKLIAGCAGKDVVFELPDEVEKAGYSTATVARLDGSKLRGLGFSVRYDIKEGITRTVEILSELQAGK
jgi:nucleoside-diphosphate-sugar epimerase